MKKRLPLPPAVAKLYAAIAELESAYGEHGRRFTLDGHLLGSVGEVLAATAFNMKLLKMSAPIHDAVCGDRGDVQIKITASASVALRHECNHLVVFRIVSPEEAEIFYDGPGALVWENCGPKQSNGQRKISLKKIDDIARI
jgi:hypothetical protein